MMKKLIILAATAFLLVGCQDATISAPSKDSLFTFEGKTVTKEDLFNVMNGTDAGSTIITNAQKTLLETLYPLDDALKAEVQTEIDTMKATYGEMWTSILSYYGFTSDEEYAENMILPSLRLEKALKQAMTDDYTGMIDGLYVRKAAILEVPQDKAAEAKAALDSGTSWADVVKTYATDTATYKGTEAIYTKNSTGVDNTALSYIISAQEPGISDPQVITSTTDIQLIVNVIATDAESIKDEVIESFISDTTQQKNYLSKLLKDNGFKVYDKGIYDAIKEDYPDALAN